MRNNDVTNRNVKLIADGSRSDDWFDLYIELPGRKEYLMRHRRNGMLFDFLKDGKCVADIQKDSQKKCAKMTAYGRRYRHGRQGREIRSNKNTASKFENTIDHLVKVASDYIRYEAV